jgi:hypothetical protein
MILYVVVTLLFLTDSGPSDPPLAVYRGTSLLSSADCEAEAAKTLAYANAQIRKAKVPLVAQTGCTRAGFEI